MVMPGPLYGYFFFFFLVFFLLPPQQHPAIFDPFLFYLLIAPASA